MSKILISLLVGALIGSISNTVIAEQKESNAISLGIKHVTTYERKGLSMQAPEGWSFISPSEIRKKTDGAIQPASNALFFVVNESDFDSNINVQYIGDTSRDAPNVETANRFLRKIQGQVESAVRQQLSGFRKIKSEIINFSGGVALDFVFTSARGNTLMKQKQIMLISNKKAFTITCTAKESVFDNYFSTGFKPILRSIKIR